MGCCNESQLSLRIQSTGYRLIRWNHFRIIRVIFINSKLACGDERLETLKRFEHMGDCFLMLMLTNPIYLDVRLHDGDDLIEISCLSMGYESMYKPGWL